MELYQCSKADYKAYMKFVKEIYSSYPNYKDSATPVLKQFLYKRGAFCSSLDMIPVMVKKGHSVVAVCIYIHARSDEQVLQIAFFEALENCQEAVDLIMEKAKQLCGEKGLSRITVGLNGHINYGIGFLCDRHDADVCFGNSFTPPYYAGYFHKFNPKQHKLVSYSGSTDTLDFKKYGRLLARIKPKFSCRSMDFRRFREEMQTYTDINNICFKDHPFYFERTHEEDYELFKELSYFITEDNIIFIEDGGKPIGYLLWYPDFNELLGYGQTIGLSTFIKNKLFSHRIKKLKLVEIAILPEYQNSGAILGLLHECYLRNARRYETLETSWIFEENYKSRNFGIKLLEKEYKHYVAYEIPLEAL